MNQRAGIFNRTLVILFVSADLLFQMLRRGRRQIRRGGLTVFLLLLSASAVKAEQYGDFYYSTDGTNATITGYAGAGGSVNIPSTINGLPVCSIGYEAFQNCFSLTSVTIPNSVSIISDRAFSSCYSLTSITIPNSVTSIGYGAFSYCYSLPSVIIPNSVTSIGEDAFENCTGLISITIGNNVTNIGDYAFYSCNSLTSITIPNSVTSIGNYAFYYCTSLTSITIPNSVTSIGNGAFYNCTNLTNITILDSVTSIGNYVFYNCTSLTGITIPNKVTSIGDGAFFYCTRLTNIIIPNNVTSIGDDAFNSCASLASITIGNNVTSIGDWAFNSCTSLASITIPDSVISIGYEAFYNCYSLTSVTIGNNVAGINNGDFYNCYNLTNVTIGKSVNSIWEEAFYSCTKLTSVYFLGNAPSLGSDVFHGDNHATIYYLDGTKGWGETFTVWGIRRNKRFGGRPTALWDGIRCTVIAGSKGDSISFSGTMSAAANDFDDAYSSSDANFVKVVISPEDTNYSCVITFPVDSKTWKKGKFSYSGTENGVKKSFRYNVKMGKFAFTASNIDLSGLECPLTIDINVGDFTGATEVNEAIVNGKKPIPINLLMGVKNSLRVDKPKSPKKSGTVTQIAISGGFSVEDPGVSMADRVSEDLVVTFGTQTFTIPANKLKAGKNKFTCSKVKLYDISSNLIGTASATFDFKKYTFTLTIKNTSFTADSGINDFEIAFANFSGSDMVTLP